MYYDPLFYESRAAAMLVEQGQAISRNVRIPVMGKQFAHRPEVDAIAFQAGGEEPRLFEFKSYPLTSQDLDSIEAKYRQLTPFGVTVIAPSLPRRSTNNAYLRSMEFRPDLSAITRYYAESFVNNIPALVLERLANGLHHIRYLMPTRARTRQRRFFNQIDKRIRSARDLRREILDRLPEPPVRVYWSTATFRNPKWLFHGEGRPIDLALWACDIDGPDLHAGLVPCSYSMDAVCPDCLRYSSIAAGMTTVLLEESGHRVSLTVDSGRRGTHLYIDQAARDSLMTTEARRRQLASGLRLDFGSLESPRALVGLPGSLHGYSMRPVVEIEPVTDVAIEDWELPYRRD